MRTHLWIVATSATLFGVVACSDDPKTGNVDEDAGSGNGGSSAGTGGRSAGGSSPGGAPSAGGRASTGGATSTGGASSGGASAGGAGAGGIGDSGAGGAPASDSGTGGTGTGGAGTGDAGPEGGVSALPRAVAVSDVGHDRFHGVTFDSAGNIYATGHVAGGTAATDDFSIVVAKFLPNGDPDPSFDGDGFAIRNVTVGGTNRELARGIVVQSTGKVVVAGAAEHDPQAAGVFAGDTDIVVLRFNADGSPDDSFDGDGLAVFDLNTGIETQGTNGPQISGGDSQWSLALTQGNKLVIHGTQLATGLKSDGVTPRSDADWVLLQLTEDGVPDATFSGDGKVTLDIAEGGATARTPTVLADGSIIGVGYTTTEALGTSSQQPVLYKVTSVGDFDTTFATADAIGLPGVWHDYAVPRNAEAYGAVLSGGQLVTWGYGPTPSATGTGTDLVSFRFSTAGVKDVTYGSSGASYIDVGGYGDNGRSIVALGDGRVLGVGAGRPTPAVPPGPTDPQPPQDGLVAVLTATGAPDTTFGAGGFRLYDLGGPADHFWSVALSPNGQQVAIVGIASAPAAGTDDDAALFLLPLDD